VGSRSRQAPWEIDRTPARLELLDLLAQGEKTVETLARHASRSVTSTSNHLKELRTAGLVESRRDGSIHPLPPRERRSAHARSLQEVARSRLAEVQRLVDDYFGENEADFVPVTARELAQRLHGRDAFVIDVRPAAEFETAHIPGAVNVPPDDLEHRLGELPRDREIVAYCRGPYCVFAHDAVRLLRSRGYDARRLAIGLPDWRAAGYATAAGGGR
jgi:rhodanese-related sulfurtransferase/DNA-binding transcriptional ArsR family regulator